MELSGKTALVTGAAKRVGREISLELAKRGVKAIGLHYRNSEADAKKTADEIRALGAACDVFKADLSDAGQTLNLAQKVWTHFGTVDILVNNASLYYKTPISRVTESDWDSLVDANLKGPFLLSKEIGTRMAEKNGGKIINIADWSGLRPYKDFGAYCVSKAGLIALTKTLARDLAPKVQSNAVAPGPILPPEDMTENEKESIAKTTALGRWGHPRDVAYAVGFLIESDFINGTVLVVDGGRSIV